MAVITFGSQQTPIPQETYIASLSAQNSEDQFLALYERRTNTLRITQTTGKKPKDRDYELWLIAPQEPPVSLGVVGSKNVIPPSLQEKFTEGATLAVSVEPRGGSKVGAPTGPIVALGPVKKI